MSVVSLEIPREKNSDFDATAVGMGRRTNGKVRTGMCVKVCGSIGNQRNEVIKFG